MNQESFGSFLPLKVKRTFLFLFTRREDKIIKYMKGYNHVCLVEYINDGFVYCYEPLFNGCSTLFRAAFTKEELKDFKVLEVTIYPTRQQILIKPLLQTCATVVQYLAGISMCCFSAQGLYDSLTKINKQILMEKGIQEVKEWV